MKNNFLKKSLIIILFWVVFLIPVLSFAQDCSTTPPPACCSTVPPTCSASDGKTTTTTTINNPITPSTVNEFIKTILIGFIKIGIPLVALAIIYSGFLYVSARGRSKEIETAHTALLYTVIGAALLLGAWTIAQLISETILQIK